MKFLTFMTNVAVYFVEFVLTCIFTFFWSIPFIKYKLRTIRHKIRGIVLTIRPIKRNDGSLKIDLRFLGVKIGRATYCRIGRLLGRKKDN